MDVDVRFLGGKRFEMSARGHHVVADQPFDDDGADSAMTPPELFLSSLGACAGYYGAEYLRARGIDPDGLAVHVSGTKGEKPARVVSVTFEVTPPAGLDERQREGLLRAVDKCLLKNTLVTPPSLEVRLVFAGAAVQPEAELVGAR